jgi:hypothetical protein
MNTSFPEPTCGDCKAFYMEAKDEHGTIRGLCRLRPELGEIPSGMDFCNLFRVRDSRADKVADVSAKIASKKSTSRTGASRGDDVPPVVHRATLQNPVCGDTEGEITMDKDGLKQVLRELLEEESMYGYPTLGHRWAGGELIMKPGREDTQAKEVPIDTFFHKIVMVRDKLRVLEAKINGNDKLDEQDKVELQGYISKCYGSLTTFNVLFQDKKDHFSSK